MRARKHGSRQDFANARVFLSPFEAAERFSVSERTIRRRIADGTITGYRLPGGRLIRVDAAEVEAAFLNPIPTAG